MAIHDLKVRFAVVIGELPATLPHLFEDERFSFGEDPGVLVRLPPLTFCLDAE